MRFFFHFLRVCGGQKVITFNSLYEILRLLHVAMLCGLLSTFNSLYEIPRESGRFMYLKETFNSLYEIPRYARRSSITPGSWLSILFMRFSGSRGDRNLQVLAQSFNSLYEIPRAIFALFCYLGFF